MATEKVFKTKTGYCHLLPDKIVLTRHGFAGDVANVTMGNNIARPLIIYTLISIGLIFLGIKDYNEGQSITAFLFIVSALFLIFAIIKSLNNSTTPVIDRKKIKNIEFKKAALGLTRSYFIVRFQSDGGKIKRRLILLPGSLSDGKIETEKALRLMKQEFGEIKNAS